MRHDLREGRIRTTVHRLGDEADGVGARFGVRVERISGNGTIAIPEVPLAEIATHRGVVEGDLQIDTTVGRVRGEARLWRRLHHYRMCNSGRAARTDGRGCERDIEGAAAIEDVYRVGGGR